MICNICCTSEDYAQGKVWTIFPLREIGFAEHVSLVRSALEFHFLSSKVFLVRDQELLAGVKLNHGTKNLWRSCGCQINSCPSKDNFGFTRQNITPSDGERTSELLHEYLNFSPYVNAFYSAFLFYPHFPIRFCRWFSMTVGQYHCLPACQPVSLYICLSVCRSLCLSVCMCVWGVGGGGCLSVCLSLFQSPNTGTKSCTNAGSVGPRGSESSIRNILISSHLIVICMWPLYNLYNPWIVYHSFLFIIKLAFYTP